MKTNRILTVTMALLPLALSGRALAQDPAVVNAKTITVKLENDRVRVLEAVLEPGDKEQMHAHPAYVYYVIEGGRMRSHTAEGKTAETDLKPGQVFYRDQLVHWAENIGTTTVRVVLVELKNPAIAAGSDDGVQQGEGSKLRKSREVLELSGAGTLGVQAMTQMIPALKQMAPEAPELFWQEFMAEVRPESLIDLIAPIYSEHFEEAELDALIAFYSSPVGRKMVERLPAITAESMAVGQAWGTEIAKRAMEKLNAGGLPPSSP